MRSLIPVESADYSTTLDIRELLLLRGELQETFSHLSTELKYSIIDCLIKQNLLVPVFGSAVSANSDSKYMSRMKEDALLRKHLAIHSVSKYSDSSAFSAPTVIPRRRTQDSQASLSPFDGTNSPSLQPSSEAPIPEVDPKDFSPTALPGGYPGPNVSNSIPGNATSEQTKNNTKAIIIAVVVTATVTLTLAALCFYCFYRYLERKYHFGNVQKDERPLLSLSQNNFSGSSHVNFGENGALSFMVDPTFQLSSPPLLNPKPPLAPALVHPSHEGTPPLKGGPPPPKGGPPPPPKGGPPPPKGGPPPPKGGLPPGIPLAPKGPRPPQPSSSSSPIPHTPSHISTNDFDSSGSKTKLKPFFWDKVMTNPDQSMVWHQIKSGSFQFNEEMIETLFGYNAIDNRWSDTKKDFTNDPSSHYIQILDPKKAQNLAISMKARNVTVTEVCDALMEGNELPVELLQILLKLAPTTDEELKLSLFNGNTSSLGPAEQFLKTIVNIPFAFKRMDALLLMAILKEESAYVKESFATLEEACKELRNSRLFLKLLEAVLKMGNRMNDGTYRGRAQAFKLDTLLKLSDVKGTDGKTTLLHFVVREIIRSEGKRAIRVAKENRSRSNVTISTFNSGDLGEHVPEESEDQYCTLGLGVVSGLRDELEIVKKAAGLDAEALTGTVVNLSSRLLKTKEFLNTDMRNLDEESGFHDSLKAFVEHAEADTTFLLEEEKRIKLFVKNTADYFYGTAGRDEGLRLFVIVRDFLVMLDKACKEVREAPKKVIRTPRNNGNPTLHSILEPKQMLFPEIKGQHLEGFSSDDEVF